MLAGSVSFRRQERDMVVNLIEGWLWSPPRLTPLGCGSVEGVRFVGLNVEAQSVDSEMTPILRRVNCQITNKTEAEVRRTSCNSARRRLCSDCYFVGWPNL